MIGLIVLVTFSCSTAVIKKPQPVYIINSKFGSVAFGKKDFNYKHNYKFVGEWVEKPKLIKWSAMPENIIGFPLEIWLTIIKPALKEVSRKKRDTKD